MSAIDRVLSAIDSGLQSSSETGYATDRAEMCVRCQRVAPVEDGELCGACRSWLLGDGPPPTTVTAVSIVAELGRSLLFPGIYRAAAADDRDRAFIAQWCMAVGTDPSAVEALAQRVGRESLLALHQARRESLGLLSGGQAGTAPSWVTTAVHRSRMSTSP